MRNSPDIVREARTWVGTPYRHAARLKGVGVDCVGVILGVGVALGHITPAEDLGFLKYRGYSRIPNPRRMLQGMCEYLVRLDEPITSIPADGSIGWFQWREDLPMHLGIVATFNGRRTMIHAFNQAERCVENSLDAVWLGRVHSWWAFRE
jgi:NlpC/P60 family putative phage cell wall peptidase